MRKDATKCKENIKKLPQNVKKGKAATKWKEKQGKAATKCKDK